MVVDPDGALVALLLMQSEGMKRETEPVGLEVGGRWGGEERAGDEWRSDEN